MVREPIVIRTVPDDRRALLLGSLAFHVLLGAGLYVGSIIAVDEVRPTTAAVKRRHHIGCFGPRPVVFFDPPNEAPANESRPTNVPASKLDADVVYRPDPSLPERVRAQIGRGEERAWTAKLCVDRDGRVFDIKVIRGIPGADDSITTTLRTWRYRPQPIPVCFVANLRFYFQ